MGLCTGKEAVKSVGNGAKRNKQVDDMLKEDGRIDNAIHKLLLLGPGESGKSTFYKQMVLHHGNGFREDQRKQMVQGIRENIVMHSRLLAVNVDLLGEGIDLSPENLDYIESIRDEEAAEAYASKIESGLAENIKRLWHDPAIQAVWKHRAHLQVPESTEYFLSNRLDDVYTEDYIPSDEDILRMRARTTGILQTNFSVEGEDFMLVDVGGQRSERRKWIQCFDNVSAILFLCAVAEYDQLIFEDEKTNRVHEGINLFKTVANNPIFDDAVIILFLNKMDLFSEKIQHVSLRTCFPEYEGPDGVEEEAVNFIIDRFEENFEKDKELYVHLTQATDTESCLVVFGAVKDALLRRAMEKVGMFGTV